MTPTPLTLMISRFSRYLLPWLFTPLLGWVLHRRTCQRSNKEIFFTLFFTEFTEKSEKPPPWNHQERLTPDKACLDFLEEAGMQACNWNSNPAYWHLEIVPCIVPWHGIIKACADVVIPMHDPIKSGPLQAREPFGEQVSFDEIYLKQQDPQYSKMC